VWQDKSRHVPTGNNYPGALVSIIILISTSLSLSALVAEAYGVGDFFAQVSFSVMVLLKINLSFRESLSRQ
jgi:hypothetical protein